MNSSPVRGHTIVNSALQSRTLEYRWGVVDASEPPDIRPVRGYVTVLEHQSPADSAFVTYKLLFSDEEGHSLTAFPSQDFGLFASAAVLAMAEVEGVEACDAELDNGPSHLAVLVPLALPGM